MPYFPILLSVFRAPLTTVSPSLTRSPVRPSVSSVGSREFPSRPDRYGESTRRESNARPKPFLDGKVRGNLSSGHAKELILETLLELSSRRRDERARSRNFARALLNGASLFIDRRFIGESSRAVPRKVAAKVTL